MTKEQEIAHVFKNRDLIITEKKNVTKHGDFCDARIQATENVTKAGVEITGADSTVLNAKLVINTTNVIDSHMDCHINGLWKKSLKENKNLLLLQEHQMDFEKVIADSVNDNLKANTETIEWKQLGYNFIGSTEALIFNAQIKKDVNEFMFNLYRKGRVLNHSVGMRYVKMFLCINSNEAAYSSEKANWEKYYPVVVNPQIADEKGYFWAITEAMVIEGSAVVKGSNEFTPTMEIEIEKEIEAVENTSTNEPLKDTQNNTGTDPKKTISIYF